MIDNTTAKSIYTIQDGVTSYAIGFQYNYNTQNNPEIAVYKNNHPEDPMVYGTDWEISANGLDVVLLDNYEVGDRLVIVRNIEMVQRSDYIIGRIDPEQIEKDFDESVMRDQQLQAELDLLEELPIDHEARIQAIESKIPAAATSSNQLTDKNYVDTADGGLQQQITTNKGTMDGHIANTSNPHSVTKTQVGLGNCDNTSDLNKPVSAATQSALDLKANTADLGTAAYTASTDYATATQGGKADTALQPNDNVSSLVNDAGFLTSMTLDGLTDTTITSVADGEFLRYDSVAGKWVNATSSASIGFDGITGSPYDNTALGKELDIKTNCLTVVPQDIKLELNAGTLTLKAGSKCYLKTDTTTPSVNIASDLTTTQTTDGTYFAIYDGSTLTTVLTNAYDYSTLPNTYSYPLAIVIVSGGAITSIKQIFNGFGFIGSTVFVLPGVKGLVPNGRNSDGSLRNAETSITQITTWTNSGYTFKDFQMKITNNGLAVGSYTYDEIYNINNEVGCIVGLVGGTSGSIDYIKPKTVFHAVDTNDINHILAVMYPIGALYIGTQNTCPMSIVMPGTTWEIVATNRALWGGDGTNGTTTIAAGLPNFSVTLAAGDLQKNGSDGSEVSTWSVSSGAGAHAQRQVTVKGSDSSSVYSDSVTTVQPPAYVINVWRRTA